MDCTKKSLASLLVFAAVLCLAANGRADELDVNRLCPADINRVEQLLAGLEPMIKQRQEKGNLATLTPAELYGPLDCNQAKLLKSFEKLDARKLGVKIPYRGTAQGRQKLVTIKGQKIRSKDGCKELPAQFLPPGAYKSCTKMMRAMQKDVGRRLYVESGYRSSAYQLYLFVLYLKDHNYSIKEMSKFVALPGYSEHGGDPRHQAMDFINEDGVNGQDDTEAFEELAEYKWLLANARKFGFVLSYPRDANEGISFEPWHWRYEKNALSK